ncbi:radical SAM protein [Erythrobacter sp. JK5]|uniref:radical SAM protein n=1 Tax=Erythrobacter sp. JK5 TaxID=2829500 RepID=UPI001BACE87B|nr:radical SAM protein [Erythrobacter sp. JK5]QUL37526.1 radical SAM protein [Erythrobacter sp. JK5]
MPPRSKRVWQVKVSTLCNLRCRYCYEWDRLADTARMGLPVWREVFEAIRDLRVDANPDEFDRIIWHGGEPTLLPPDYVLNVLALQRDVLGEAIGAGGARNAVQTNLFAWNETLDIFVSSGFEFSVSMDVVPGTRPTAGGKATEAATVQNLAQLVARGAKVGVILVLTRENRDHLAAAHDLVAGIGVDWLRIIPVFASESAAPVGNLILSPEETVEALLLLDGHRATTGQNIPVIPLDRARAAAERFRNGETATHTVPTRIIVQPDGRIGFEFGERLRLSDWPGENSLASAISQPRTNKRDDRTCRPCGFQATCNRRALEDWPDTKDEGPCPVEARLLAEMVS